MSDGTALGAFMFGEYFAGTTHDVGGQPGEFRHLNSVALVSRAFVNFSQEDYPATALFHRHMQILHTAKTVGQLGQLVVMGGEEGLGAGVSVDVLDGCPRNGEPVVGRSTASDFVEQDPVSYTHLTLP